MADSNQSPQQTTKTALQRIDQALPKFQKVYGENANTIFQRESGFAALAIRKNPFLLKCDPDSMYEAIVSLAFTGLTLNPVSKQAYLVPRDKKVVLDISYMGMIDILTKTGCVSSIRAGVVYGDDEFDYQLGTGAFLKHKPSLTESGQAKKIAAYAVATLPNGNEEFYLMPWHEVMKRRNVSTSYANEKSRKYSPWVKWEDEMAIKTVIRQFYKFLPKTESAKEIINIVESNEPIIVNPETGEIPELKQSSDL